MNLVIVRVYLIDVFRSFRFQYELLKRGGAVGEGGPYRVTVLTGPLSLPNIITASTANVT
jgi:hypothetical protein